MENERVLTIQRSKWRRGGSSRAELGPTYLLNSKGLMCCLGFDALACGFEPHEIEDKSDPSDLYVCEGDGRPGYMAARVVIGTAKYDDGGTYTTRVLTPACGAAISHNDCPGLSDDERERLIAEDLRALGWDRVEFVD